VHVIYVHDLDCLGQKWSRAATPAAVEIVVKDIIFILIAVVIVVIIIVVIIVVIIVEEGWLNEVMVIFRSNG